MIKRSYLCYFNIELAEIQSNIIKSNQTAQQSRISVEESKKWNKKAIDDLNSEVQIHKTIIPDHHSTESLLRFRKRIRTISESETEQTLKRK